MALIKCPECQKEISDKAASCPGCGSPVSTSAKAIPRRQPHTSVTRTGAKWEGIGFVLIIVGMLAAFMTGANNHIGGVLVLLGFVTFIIGRFQ